MFLVRKSKSDYDSLNHELSEVKIQEGNKDAVIRDL